MVMMVMMTSRVESPSNPSPSSASRLEKKFPTRLLLLARSLIQQDVDAVVGDDCVDVPDFRFPDRVNA